MIKVFDNIFPPQLVDYIEKIVLHNPTFPLYYTHNIAETLSFSPGLNSRLYEDKLDPNLIFTENREHLSTFNEILYSFTECLQNTQTFMFWMMSKRKWKSTDARLSFA